LLCRGGETAERAGGREVAADHQAGVFAGTNDVIETIGRRPPMTLEALIEKHRKAFE